MTQTLSHSGEDFGATPQDNQATADETSREMGKRLALQCAAFKGAQDGRAALQFIGNFLALLALCAVMYHGFVNEMYWLTAALWLPSAFILVRLFIVQHDCSHGSFFSRSWANRAVGRFVSLLTFTPFSFWRNSHNRHHATSGDLDRQGTGDMITRSTDEYNEMSIWRKLQYRLYRNPVILLVFGVPFQIILKQRVPFGFQTPTSRIWKSIVGHDIGLVAFYGTLIYFLGFWPLFTVFMPVVVMTAWIGGWMFFIQHQFEDSYWSHQDDWDFYDAAVKGSSYYVLPKFLHWCTGNIGLHHIHHLCSGIPNYRLQECLKAIPELEDINRLTLGESWKCAFLALWHEKSGKMLSFRQARQLQAI